MATKPYWNQHQMEIDGVAPDILAIGDSWFNYPINNLVNPINNFWNGRYDMLVMGQNGAEAAELLSHQSWDIAANLSSYRAKIKLILISMGGNDITGSALSDMLKADCSTAINALDCFRSGEPEAHLVGIDLACRQLIELRDMHGCDAPIVAHNYDYAQPNGRGTALVGKRLEGPLEHGQVPRTLWSDLITLLIDELGVTLRRLMRPGPGGFEVVETAGTLAPDEWGFEAHPSFSGFNKLAAEKFRPVLTNILQ